MTLFHAVCGRLSSVILFSHFLFRGGGRETGGRIQLSKVSRLLRSTSPAGPAAIGRREDTKQPCPSYQVFPTSPVVDNNAALDICRNNSDTCLDGKCDVSLSKCQASSDDAHAVRDVVESQEHSPNLTVCSSCSRV